jgi:hypothetical protein
MIDDMSLVLWQIKELCHAFPGRVIDVNMGLACSSKQLQDFKHRLSTLGLYVKYVEKYDDGQIWYDMDDYRIQVSTDVITCPASDGTDVTFDAQRSYYALCKYDSHYVIKNTEKMKHDTIDTYLREYAIIMQITYPLKNFSVCTESNSESSFTYKKDGNTITEWTLIRTVSAPIFYEAKYTEEELDLLVNASASASAQSNSRPTKRLKIGL